MKQNNEKINVNIWDDYYPDNSKEKQDTYIVVEDLSLKNLQKKEVLTKVLRKIKKHLPKTVKTKLVLKHSRWQIDVENLTHKMREEVLNTLDSSKKKLYFNNRPISFISES